LLVDTPHTCGVADWMREAPLGVIGLDGIGGIGLEGINIGVIGLEVMSLCLS
jgi:hypothetical protein